jgi:transcription initiation factor TFIIB
MRFCSKLNCADMQDTCISVVRKIDTLEIVSESSPPSIASACIYLVANCMGKVITKKRISECCDISEVTVCKCHKKLFAYRAAILPTEFIYTYDVK